MGRMAIVGCAVGALLFVSIVGAFVGGALGALLGEAVGAVVFDMLSLDMLTNCVGATVGVAVGVVVGAEVGAADGQEHIAADRLQEAPRAPAVADLYSAKISTQLPAECPHVSQAQKVLELLLELVQAAQVLKLLHPLLTILLRRLVRDVAEAARLAKRFSALGTQSGIKLGQAQTPFPLTGCPL